MRALSRPGLILILLVLLSFPAPAQYQMCTITGIVRAGNGEPIAGVKVQVLQGGRTASSVTDGAGHFIFYYAEPGPCSLRFEHSHAAEAGIYQTTIHRSLSLRLNVVLDCRREAGGDPGCWRFTELEPEAQGPWQPERILTQDQIEVLPSVEHLWQFLNHTEPSVVAERYDIGGLHSQEQLLPGVRGSSWTQNQISLNGLTVMHPSGEGSLQLPDMTALEAIVYSVGGSPGIHTGPGAHLALIPKTGDHELHGQAHVLFQAGALQNSNPTDRDRFFGITESDERWRHFLNAGFQLGGPLGERPWTYFGSFAIRDLAKRIRNHPLPVSASVSQGTIHISGALSTADRLALYWSGEYLGEPEAGSSPQTTREASLDKRQSSHALQGAWTRRVSPRSLLDARFGLVMGRVDEGFQPGARLQSAEDLFPGFVLSGVPRQPDPWGMVDLLNNTRRGAAALATDSNTDSWEASADYATVRSSIWSSLHRISAGASWRRTTLTQEYSALDSVNLLFFEGAPDSVRLLNTPARTRERLNQIEVHADDGVWFGRFSLTVGAYADFTRGENLLGTGEVANRRIWANVSGRLGLAYKVMERRPLVLRTGVARIYYQPLASTWTAVNPEGLGTRLYSWVDANGDGQFQTGENTSLLKVSGSPYSTMESGLKNPRTAEVTLGLTQGGLRGLTFNLFGFRRFDQQLMSLVNVGVPFSSYTPVQVTDPGPDGFLDGGGDDQMITVFNQKPESLGQDRYILSNPQGLDGYSEGYELRLAFSSARFQVEAAMTRYRAVASTAPGITARDNDTSALQSVMDDPNKAIFARGSTYFDRGTLGRLWATSSPGWDIHCSLIISYQDGLPYSRYLPIKGLNQGIVGVLTRPRGPGDAGSIGGFMTTHNGTIDIRAAKDLRRGSKTLTTTLDVFNLANSSLSLVQTDVTAPTHLWRIPLRFQTPRSLQLGLRFRW